MLKLTIFASILVVVSASHQQQFETVFQWNFVQYNWPSTNEMMEALESGKYIPENNLLIGLKIWKNKMYLTIPRFKDGVPVTLAVTSATPLNGDTAPNLDPYPSWEMQTEGNCSAFQLVHSMEIDPLGRMWVLDTGRTETMNANPVTWCPPRLIILDLEDGGKILRTYEFPDEVASIGTVLLNDIILDHEDGGWAYISDSQKDDPGIIVYSLQENASWKVRNNRSMRAQADAVNFTVAGTPVSASSGVNGIALSPLGSERILYYSPLPSFYVYFIPVSVLKRPSSENIDEQVTLLGRRISQTGGMIMTNKGVLYYGLMNDDSIAAWNSSTNSSFTDDSEVIFTDYVRSQWPDTFCIDDDGYLWFTTNEQQNFLADNVNISEPNYRILRGIIHTKNYQYLPNGASPSLPAID